jgi:pilus assembly protein TadC
VLLGSLLAGFGMPVVANIILGFMPGLKDVMASLKPLVSICIGGVVPMLVPSAIEAAKRWINNQLREVK